MNDAKPESYGPGSTVPGPVRTMWADTSQLYESAHVWEATVAAALSRASSRVLEGATSRHLFGLALAPVGAAHDRFVENAADQLRVGSVVAGEMGARLRETAADWVRTDEGVAADEDRLRSRA